MTISRVAQSALSLTRRHWQRDGEDRTEMEDQNLIVAVCSRPVLYDTTMVSYRDRNKKERAWVDVAEDTGFPVDVCRRKWKSLRVRYMREKKREKGEKRAGQRQGQ
ncbi:unnamed protein product [Arctogadus glacialis]